MDFIWYKKDWNISERFFLVFLEHIFMIHFEAHERQKNFNLLDLFSKLFQFCPRIPRIIKRSTGAKFHLSDSKCFKIKPNPNASSSLLFSIFQDPILSKMALCYIFVILHLQSYLWCSITAQNLDLIESFIWFLVVLRVKLEQPFVLQRFMLFAFS